jgi:dTDP-4-dehydrorhamnose reductase
MPRVLVTGASGLLGGALVATAPPAVAVVAQIRRLRLPPPLAARAVEEPLDLRDAGALRTALDRHRPGAVIHTAARTVPFDCEAHPADAHADNVTATGHLVTECTARGLRLLHCSTDLVFDGTAAPYAEDAERRPISEYGRSKAAAEDLVAACPRALVARLPLLYGTSPAGNRSVDESLAAAIGRGESPMLFDDEFRTPLHVRQAGALLWELLAGETTGTIHVAGRDRVSRWELGCALADRLGLPRARLRRGSIRDFRGIPPRCPDVSLDVGQLTRILGRPAPTLAEGLTLPLARPAA